MDACGWHILKISWPRNRSSEQFDLPIRLANPQMSKFLFPMGWQTLNFQFRQSDHDKHLPACDQELPIARPVNAESAPKSAPLEALELAMNQKLVPKLSGLSIIDFGSDD